MTDFHDPVQTVCFARLADQVTLAPVFSIVPDKTSPPTVVIGESQAEQVGGKNSNTERHDFVVRSFVEGTSKRALFAMMNEVKAALHNWRPAIAGFSLSRVVMTSSGELRDLDEAVLVGEQNFSVFVTAA
jgi:hypothetical protein